MITKQFIPSIYLSNEHCIKSLKDTTIVETDPFKVAQFYFEEGMERLIIFDLSKSDAEHDAHINIIIDICSNLGIQVSCCSFISRMEDVKKYLYAGCKSVYLFMENEIQEALLKEVSLKFGKDKINLAINNTEILSQNLSLIQEYASQLLLLNPHMIRELESLLTMPYLVHINDLALNKLMEILNKECIAGITGNTVNQNMKEIPALKELCQAGGIPIEEYHAKLNWNDFKLLDNGLLPVIVQDYKTNQVLMMAYMNEEAYNATIASHKMTYFSRSRNELWLKGDTSGHFQFVKELTADCDRDTLLAKVQQVGAACHTGAYSCFFDSVIESKEEVEANPLVVFEEVFDVIKDRKLNPKEGSYTNYLFDKGIDKILKKLGEEAVEIVIAAKNPNKNEVKYEISDFLYHMMVLMAEQDVTWEEITNELANR